MGDAGFHVEVRVVEVGGAQRSASHSIEVGCLAGAVEMLLGAARALPAAFGEDAAGVPTVRLRWPIPDERRIAVTLALRRATGCPLDDARRRVNGPAGTVLASFGSWDAARRLAASSPEELEVFGDGAPAWATAPVRGGALG